MSSCQWLFSVDVADEAMWGGEAAALAAVAREGIPVLPGFVVGKAATLSFFLQSDVRAAILKACKGLSLKKPEGFVTAAHDVRRIILGAKLPTELRSSLCAYLEELEDHLMHVKGKGVPLTITWQGVDRLHHHGTPASCTEAEKLLKELFAQLFSDRALYDRFHNGESIVPAPAALLVHYAPASEVSGLSQCYDSVNHDGNVVQVEVGYHDYASHPRHAADVYRFDLQTLHPLSQDKAAHQWAHTRKGHVSAKLKSAHVTVDDRQLRLLARFTKRAQCAFPDLQQFHWQVAGGALMFSGITPLQGEGGIAKKEDVEGRLPLAIGHALHLGFITGPVRIITKKSDWNSVQDGDIVVTDRLTSKDLEKLPGVGGLITENGHHTSEEAALAKQLDIPALGGIGAARKIFRSAQLVTLDATHGAVYAGRIPVNSLKPHRIVPDLPITGTKIYAALDDALSVSMDDLRNTDGIGMLRGEFILRLLGVHPKEVLHHGMADEYVELLTEGIERALKAASGKPVIYQLHDITEHGFNGWRTWRREKHEPNQLIGYRGTHRLLSEPEILGLELRALQVILKKHDANLSVMLPMVRSVKEVQQARALLREKAPELVDQLWVRVETPALAIQAEALAKLELAGVLFDVPALATLITGMDHENHQVAHHRDQADEAVQDALRYAISTCREEGVATVLIAEQESLVAEIVETAIKSGVTALCSHPSDAEWLRALAASVEQRMLLDHLVESA
jgi:pyruvate, water dikinase